ncbi:MAG TPA: DUF448 domain-containing protein [Desulfohalobiaceae bacterium]|nr:DUF448 domain-containing protein [Desulfohalobiaceae bacterium]
MSSTHIPYRMCAICKKRFTKRDLQRHVLRNMGNGKKEFLPDPHKLLPGRGYYVCSHPQCQKRFNKFRGWKKCRG